jgi:hypothetical protein
MVVTNAKMNWSELLVLNGSGPATKREALETSLDRSILALKRLAEERRKFDQLDLTAVTDTLRFILDYRLRFPRSNPTDLRLSQRAQQVLNEVH